MSELVTHSPDGSAYEDHHWWSVCFITIDKLTGEHGIIHSIISSPPCACGKCERATEEEIVQVIGSQHKDVNPNVEILGGTASYLNDGWQIIPRKQAKTMHMLDRETSEVVDLSRLN